MRYDYSVFTRSCFTPSRLSELRYDVLVSAYNRSERVKAVWSSVQADTRIWINHAEYKLGTDELPSSDLVVEAKEGEGELELWLRLLDCSVMSKLPKDASIAIDITGLMRPHVVTMPLAFALRGFQSLIAIYSDPSAYVSGIGTEFSLGPVLNVAPVNGFEGQHSTSLSHRDLLIIGAGYDDQLISAVAEAKRAAEHVVLVGLPSLQPHMYQESLLKLHSASEFINNYSRREHLFAPANDPFVTAGVLSDYLAARIDRSELNVYLSPTGPKTQVLGFSWYFLCEALASTASLIFPYSAGYSQETSTGISRIREFKLELDCIQLASFGI